MKDFLFLSFKIISSIAENITIATTSETATLPPARTSAEMELKNCRIPLLRIGRVIKIENTPYRFPVKENAVPAKQIEESDADYQTRASQAIKDELSTLDDMQTKALRYLNSKLKDLPDKERMRFTVMLKDLITNANLLVEEKKKSVNTALQEVYDNKILRLNAAIESTKTLITKLEAEKSPEDIELINAKKQLEDWVRFIEMVNIAWEGLTYRLHKNNLAKLLSKIDEGEKVVLVTNTISLADVSKEVLKKLAGIILPGEADSDYKERCSHFSSLIKSQRIPLIIDGEPYRTIQNDDLVVINGLNENGAKPVIIINPSPEKEKMFRELVRMEEQKDEIFAKAKCETAGKIPVQLEGSIYNEKDIDELINLVTSISLWRTEGLFIGKEVMPSLQELQTIFATICGKIAEHSNEKGRITVRLPDFTADKKDGLPKFLQDEIKELKLEGLKLLSHKKMEHFLTDFIKTALLGSQHDNNINLIIPQWRSWEEFEYFESIVEKCKQELNMADRSIPLGVMVETPEAIKMLKSGDPRLSRIKLINIGDNDLSEGFKSLIEESNKHYKKRKGGKKAYHLELKPVVLTAILDAINFAERRGIPCRLCGAMAGKPDVVLALLSLLNVKDNHVPVIFSVDYGSIVEVKNAIRGIMLSELESLRKTKIPNLRAALFLTDQDIDDLIKKLWATVAVAIEAKKQETLKEVLKTSQIELMGQVGDISEIKIQVYKAIEKLLIRYNEAKY
ncbi:MAG: putative PEP-binding protein, partial [Candidatus Margulisiibacteriota bacterium]